MRSWHISYSSSPKNFAPDIEEAFANTFGDVLGVPLANMLRPSL